MKNKLIQKYSTPQLKKIHRLNRLRVIYAWAQDRLGRVWGDGYDARKFMHRMDRLNKIQFAILQTEKELN
jgi:peptide deformylase